MTSSTIWKVSMLLALLMTAMLGGCGGGAPETGESPYEDPIIYDAYATYVESVEVPASAVEGEAVVVRLHLSCVKKPEVLVGNLATYRVPVKIPLLDKNGDLAGMAFDTWMLQQTAAGLTPNDVMEVRIVDLPPGEKTIRIISPVRREDGGTFGQYSWFPSINPPVTVEMGYTDYTITILPKDLAP